MKIDELGLPQEMGSSDLQDSSRLAGIMTVFGFGNKIPLEKYIVDGKYVRHPSEYRYDFSRDQALCLWAGLLTQWKQHLVDRKMVNGKDWFFPSHKGHEKRCKGKSSNWFEDMWLWCEIYWSCFVNPLAEPNQLLSMMSSAPSKFMSYWLDNNKHWRKAILDYWAGWRGEPELSSHIISYIEDWRRMHGK